VFCELQERITYFSSSCWLRGRRWRGWRRLGRKAESWSEVEIWLRCPHCTNVPLVFISWHFFLILRCVVHIPDPESPSTTNANTVCIMRRAIWIHGRTTRTDASNPPILKVFNKIKGIEKNLGEICCCWFDKYNCQKVWSCKYCSCN